MKLYDRHIFCIDVHPCKWLNLAVFTQKFGDSRRILIRDGCLGQGPLNQEKFTTVLQTLLSRPNCFSEILSRPKCFSEFFIKQNKDNKIFRPLFGIFFKKFLTKQMNFLARATPQNDLELAFQKMLGRSAEMDVVNGDSLLCEGVESLRGVVRQFKYFLTSALKTVTSN